jgi:hypothetical protein
VQINIVFKVGIFKYNFKILRLGLSFQIQILVGDYIMVGNKILDINETKIVYR